MLTGEKVRLRAIEVADLPVMRDWRNDASLAQWFFEYEPISKHMQRLWYDGLRERSDERMWIAECKIYGRSVGTVGLSKIDLANGHAELSRVLVGHEFQAVGHGAEMCELVLRFSFDHLNLNRIYAQVFAENKKAIALYRKLGFVIEGALRGHVFRHGEYRDVLAMSVSRDMRTTTVK